MFNQFLNHFEIFERIDSTPFVRVPGDYRPHRLALPHENRYSVGQVIFPLVVIVAKLIQNRPKLIPVETLGAGIDLFYRPCLFIGIPIFNYSLD